NALPQSPTKVGGTWTLTIAAANGGAAPPPITLTLEQSLPRRNSGESLSSIDWITNMDKILEAGGVESHRGVENKQLIEDITRSKRRKRPNDGSATRIAHTAFSSPHSNNCAIPH